MTKFWYFCLVQSIEVGNWHIKLGFQYGVKTANTLGRSSCIQRVWFQFPCYKNKKHKVSNVMLSHFYPHVKVGVHKQDEV